MTLLRRLVAGFRGLFQKTPTSSLYASGMYSSVRSSSFGTRDGSFV
jgi:hypothetical protein